MMNLQQENCEMLARQSRKQTPRLTSTS